MRLWPPAGQVSGREVAQEALEYGWEHWERLRSMENPVGYLYKVGRPQPESS